MTAGAADSPMPPLSAAPRGRLMARLARVVVVVGAMVLIWVSAGDHPLHSPDEGRYGRVSEEMSGADSWLVPSFRGAPHLTKPPLVYWLQAASLQHLGRSELALRLPSLLAGTLSVLVLWWFVRRMRGPDMAAMAVAIYGIMPLPLFLARVATIDAILNLCWISALASGAVAVDARRRRSSVAVAWLALMWAWIALAALAKGPIAPAPFVIVGSWLALSRRWRDIGWFAGHSLWAAVIAFSPVGVWVWRIAEQHPEAWRIWREQFIDRALLGSPPQPLVLGAAGAAATAPQRVEHEPFWFYLPIFLVGFYPATCALTLPWFNMRLREAMRAFTLGDLRALLLVAVVGPLLFFSLAKGKMPAYIVAVGAPLAVLVAGAIARVLGSHPGSSGLGTEEGTTRRVVPEGAAPPLADAPLAIEKLPDVRWTFFIATLLGCVGAIVAAGVMGGGEWVVLLVPFLSAPALAFAAVLLWNHRTAGRGVALLLIWLAVAVVLLCLVALEDRALIERRMGAREVVERVQRLTGSKHPQFVIYSFRNPTIDFYADADPLMIWSVSDLRSLWPKLREDHVILLPQRTWIWIQREYPRLAEVMVPLEAEGDGDAGTASASIWNRWPGKPTVLLRMTGPSQEDEGRSDSEISPEPHE